MTNTLENKARFFAQYWGQKIGRNGNWDFLMVVDDNPISKIDYLELKPLSQISDEDAIETLELLDIAEFETPKECAQWIEDAFVKNMWSHRTKNCCSALDYLRSKGYALPYMGISVEKQVEWGWIKLIENKNI